ncbi:MAG: MgtC/SapB family protein [Clostridiales bacterium]|nr:MgtC/SapB family protein [Clostridiales bacterium]
MMQQWELMVRIVVACILGACIGFERKNRNKMAGVRTHAVVAFGSALIMVISKYGFMDMGGFDGTRIAAQIVSGIGFLGAGIIFVRNNNSVSGLTTAAGIWATAGVGMACGAGQYFISASSTFLLVILQIVLHKVSFFSKEACRADVRVIMNGGDLQKLEQHILREKVSIMSMKVNKLDEENTKLDMDLLLPPDCDKTDFISGIAERDDVVSVRGR